jgi:hypothetical protein
LTPTLLAQPDGGFSVTSHAAAAAAFTMIIEVGQAGVKVSVEDQYPVPISDTRLVALVALVAQEAQTTA